MEILHVFGEGLQRTKTLEPILGVPLKIKAPTPWPLNHFFLGTADRAATEPTSRPTYHTETQSNAAAAPPRGASDSTHVLVCVSGETQCWGSCELTSLESMRRGWWAQVAWATASEIIEKRAQVLGACCRYIY